jgi:hypothetical protein
MHRNPVQNIALAVDAERMERGLSIVDTDHSASPEDRTPLYDDWRFISNSMLEAAAMRPLHQSSIERADSCLALFSARDGMA